MYKLIVNDKFIKIGIQVPVEELMTEYSVVVMDTDIPVLPSNPVRIEQGAGSRQQNTWFYEAERAANITEQTRFIKDSGADHTMARITNELNRNESNGKGYITRWGTEKNDQITFTIQVPKAGIYAVDFRYKNDNGPINTGDKCALRTMTADGQHIKVIIFPQRGSKTDWGFSASARIELLKGKHTISLVCDADSYSQHHQLPPVSIDLLRVCRLE